jgi:uncharacterized protein
MAPGRRGVAARVWGAPGAEARGGGGGGLLSGLKNSFGRLLKFVPSAEGVGAAESAATAATKAATKGEAARIASKRKEALREEALRLCARNLADSVIRLWPFPTVEPSVGGMLEVVPHVQAAQFGRIDELRALLDNTPELIDQANDRSMAALMAAAHGGHTAVVAMLLERGADVTRRDDSGVSALEFAIREDRQEVVLAILDHAGPEVNAVGPRGGTALLVACEFRREAIARALLDRGAKVKVDALKNRLDIESTRMLAKIGTEKGIMLFGIKRDQKEANFRNQGLSPGDAILLATDLVTGGLASLNLSDNQLCGLDMWGN